MLQAILALLLILNTAGISPDHALQQSHQDAAVPLRDILDPSVGVVVTASSSLILDVDSGEYLWQNAIDEQVSIASITKLITAMTLLEHGVNWQQEVVMQSTDQRAQGGNRHIYLGEKLTVEDLFIVGLVASDNEAISALIRAHGFSESEFVDTMRAWLKANGFENTVVVEPTGLDARNTSTAREVARLAEIAFKNDLLGPVLQIRETTVPIIGSNRLLRVENTNQLLGSPFFVAVGKTGFTDEAGYCLTTLATIDGRHEVITVVLGSDSLQSRFQDTKALLYWIGTQYTWPSA